MNKPKINPSSPINEELEEKPAQQQLTSGNEKQHTNFRRSVHHGTPFLKRTILRHTQNKYRYICSPCKKLFGRYYEGFWENLKGHLEKSEQHKKTLTTPTLETENKQAIKHLERESLLEKHPESDDNTSQDAISDQEEMRGMEEEVQDSSWEGKGGFQTSDQMKSQESLKDQETLIAFEITQFLVMNNLPFSLGPKLAQFLQNMGKKFPIERIQETKVYDKKINFITKDCVGKTLQENLLSELENSPFAICLDGGSDKSGKAFLGVSARYFQNEKQNEPKTKFLGLIQLEDSSTGQVLYDKIMKFIFGQGDSEKLKKNFVGLSCDHGSNMISSSGSNDINIKGKGLANRLKKTFEQIFVIHDFAHAWNLIIQEAISNFPAEVVDIVSRICSHFSRAAQERFKFSRFQTKLTEKPSLQILSFTEKRWSSFKECLDRILELEAPLREYFIKHGSERQKQYLESENIMYLKLLSCILGKLHFYVKFYQTEDLNNYDVLKTLKEAVTLIGELVIELPKEFEGEYSFKVQEERFSFLCNIDFSDQTKYKPLLKTQSRFKDKILEEFPLMKKIFENLDQNIAEKLLETAQKSILSCLQQMQHWLPIRNKTLLNTETIYLKQAFNDAKWVQLKESFPNIIESENAFQDQKGRLRFHYSDLQEELHRRPFLEAWRNYRSKFPLIFDLVRALMVCPYSSCSLERIFAQCTDIKTLKRNKLGVDILESILLFKQEYNISNTSLSKIFLEGYKRTKIPTQKTVEKPNFQNTNRDLSKASNDNLSNVRSVHAMEVEENSEEKKSNLASGNSQFMATNEFAQRIADATVKGFEKALFNMQTNPPLIDSSQKSKYKRQGDQIAREDLKKPLPNTRTVQQTDKTLIEIEEQGDMAQAIEDQGDMVPSVEIEEDGSKNEGKQEGL